MRPEISKSIDLFIKSIVEENYDQAKEHLRNVVNEKIKDRIRACEENFRKNR